MEFVYIVLVLLDVLNLVLIKELVYIGIICVCDWFSLVESLFGVFEEVVWCKVCWFSGLMLYLWLEREE